MESTSEEPKRRKKEKIDFKFRFRVTQVPSGWEKLVISMVSSATGKASIKTSKAVVKDGQCSWPDSVIKTAKLTMGADGESYQPKIYKFIVSKGSTRAHILGEATLDVALLASSNSEAHISLMLKDNNAGTTLHVVVQCITPRPGFSSWPAYGFSLPEPAETDVNPAAEAEAVAVADADMAPSPSGEPSMPSERTTASAASGSSMEAELLSQKKLVEHLQSVIRDLEGKNAVLEEQLRVAESQLRVAKESQQEIHNASARDMEDKIMRLELGKTELERQLQGAEDEGRMTRSQMQELREQLAERVRFEAEHRSQLPGSTELESLLDKIGRSEDQIKDFLDHHHLQTAKRAELESKIDGLETLRAQLEKQLLEEQRGKTDLFDQVTLHSITREEMDAKIMQLELGKGDMERQLEEAMQDGRHSRSQIEELRRQLAEKELESKDHVQKLGTAEVEKLLNRIGRSEDQLRDYLQEHVVSGPKLLEYNSRIEGLEMLRMQLENQLSEERRKNSDLTDLLHQHISAMKEGEAKIAHLEVHRSEAETRLLEALEAGNLSRLEMEELREQLQKSKTSTESGGYHTLSGRGELERLLDRIGRSEDQIKDFLDRHDLQAARRAELEGKIEGLEGLRAQLENQLWEERRRNSEHLDQHAGTIAEMEAKIAHLELGRHDLEKQLREALEDGTLTRGQMQQLQDQIRQREMSENLHAEGNTQVEKLLARIDKSEEQIKQYLEHHVVPSSKRAEMDSRIQLLETLKVELEGQLLQERRVSEGQLGTLLQRLDAHAFSGSEMEARIASLEADKADLQRQLQEALEVGRQHKSQADELHDKLGSEDGGNVEVETLMSRIDQSEEQIKQFLQHHVVPASRRLEMESKIQDLETFRAQLESQLADERRSSKNQLDELWQRLDGHTASAQEMQAEIEGLKLERSELQRQLTDAQEDIKSSRSYIQDLLQKVDNQAENKKRIGAAEMEKLLNRIERSENQIKQYLEDHVSQESRQMQLEAKLEQLEAERRDLENQLVKQRRGSESEIQDLFQQLNVHSFTSQELETKLAGLQIEKTELVRQLNDTQEELRQSKEHPHRVALVMHIATRDEAIERQLQEAQEEGRLRKSEAQHLHVKLTAQIAKIEQMESRINELEERRGELEGQLAHSHDERRKSSSDVSLLQGRIATFDSEIDNKVKELRRARASLKTRLEEYQIDIPEDSGEHHDVDEDGEAGNYDSVTGDMRLETTVNSFGQEHAKVLRTIAKLEKQVVVLSADKAELTRKLSHAQSELETCKTRIEELSNRQAVSLVMNVESKDEAIERQLLEALEEGRIRKSQVEELHRQLTGQITKLEDMASRIVDLETMRKELEDQVFEAHDAKRKSLSHVDLLMVRIAAFDKEIDSKVRDLQKARSALEGRLKELQIDLDLGDVLNDVTMHPDAGDQSDEGSRGLEDQLKAFERENAKFLQIIEKLERQVVSVSGERTELARQLLQAQAENQELRQKPQVSLVMNVESKDEALERQLLEAQEEGRLTRSQVQELHAQLSNKLARIEEMGSRLAELETMRSGLEEQLSHSHENRRQSLSHVDRLQLRIAEFDKEIESRVEKLHTARMSLEGRLQELNIDLDFDDHVEDGHQKHATEVHGEDLLAHRLKALEKENARSLNIISKLEQQMVSVTRERKELAVQLERCQQELSSCQMEIQDLRHQPRISLVMNVESRDEALERQLLEAQDEGRLSKSQAQELHSQLTDKLARIEEIGSRVAELETMRDKLEEQLAQSHLERRQTISHGDMLQIRLAAFDKEIESRVDDLQNARASLERRLKEIGIDLNFDDLLQGDHDEGAGHENEGSLELRLKALKTENAKSLSIVSRLEKQMLTLSQERAELSSQLSHCRLELHSCKEEIEELRHQPRVALTMNVESRDEALERQLQEAQEEGRLSKFQAQQLHSQLSDKIARIEEIGSRVTELETMRNKLEEQLAQSHDERRQSVSHGDMLQIRLAAFDKEIESRVEDLQSARSSLEGRLKEVGIDLNFDDLLEGDHDEDAEHPSVSSLELRLKAFKTENAKSLSIISRLEKQMVASSQERGELASQLSHCRLELQNCKNEVEELRHQRRIALTMNVESRDEALERQLQEAQEEGRLSKFQAQQLHSQLSDKIARIEEIGSRVAELETRRDKLEEQLAQSHDERRQSISRGDMLQIRLAAFDKEIESRVEDLQSARASLEGRLKEIGIDLNFDDLLEGDHDEGAEHPSVSSLELRLKALKTENAKSLSIISRLEKQMVTVSQERGELASQLSHCRLELQNCKNEMEELHQQPRIALTMNVESRDEALERQLQEAQEEGRLSKFQAQQLHSQLSDKIARIEEIGSRVAELETRRNKLEEQLAQSHDERRQIISHGDMLQIRLAAFDKEIESRVEDLQSARASLEGRLKEIGIDLNFDDLLEGDHDEGAEHPSVSSLELRLKALKTENAKSLSIISRLEKQMVTVSQEREELASQLSHCRLELQNCKNEMEELRHQPRVSLIMNVESRDEALERQLQEAQEEGRLSKSQAQQLHVQLSSQISRIQEMESKVDELETTRNKLENQLFQSHEEKRQSVSHLDVVQLRIAAFDSEIESKVAELRTARATLETRLRELHIDLDLVDTDSNAPSEASDDETDRNGSLELRLKAFEKENKRFLDVISRLEKQIVSLAGEKKELSKDLFEARSGLAAYKKQMEELGDQPRHHVSLVMNVHPNDELTEKQLLEAQEEGRLSKSEIRELRDELIAQVEKVERMESKIREVENMRGELEAQLQQSHEERRRSTSHLDTLRMQLAAFDSEIDNRVEDLQKARAGLESKMQGFQEELDSAYQADSILLPSETAEHSGEGEAIESTHLVDAESGRPDYPLQNRLGAFEKEHGRFLQIHEKLEGQLLSLAAERDKYKADSIRVKQELDDLKNQVDVHLSAKMRVETTALALGQSNADLESQLKEFEDGNAQLSLTVSELERKLELLAKENDRHKSHESAQPYSSENDLQKNLRDIEEDNLQLLQTVARLESQVVQISDERDGLKSELQAMGSERFPLKHGDSDTRALEAEIEELKKSKENMEHHLGKKVETLLAAVDQHELRASQAEDLIRELRTENRHLESLRGQVSEKERRARQAIEEASGLRSEELVWKDKMRQMQELVRLAAVEASAIKAEFDARVQELVDQCRASKEQEKVLESRLEEALSELEQLKGSERGEGHGDGSHQGQAQQGNAAELFQAQLDISRLAIQQLMETERKALETSLQRLKAENDLVVKSGQDLDVYQPAESSSHGHYIGLESHPPTTRFDEDGFFSDGDAMTSHNRRKLKGKSPKTFQSTQQDRRVVPAVGRSHATTTKVAPSRHVQIWRGPDFYPQAPRQEVLVRPMEQHRECLYYLDELQYLWLKFRGLAEP